MRWLTRLLPLTMLLMALTGCKTRKTHPSDADLRGVDKEKAIAGHHASHLDFKVLTLKGKADFEDVSRDTQVGFTYRIDIAKDSLILLSISKFGLPMASLLLAQDTVCMKLPMNKTAAICDYGLIKTMVDMDFNLHKFQGFVLGEAQLNEPLTLTSGKGRQIELQGSSPPYSVSWTLDSRHFKLEKVLLSDANLGKESVLTYSEFEKVDGKLVASSLQLEVTQPQKTRIELHHTGIAFDKEKVDFRFRIPESYTLVGCDQVLTR